MSTIGPATVVKAPQHGVPLISLLTSVDKVAPDPDVADYWLNGVRYLPEKCQGSGAIYAQCAPGGPSKTVNVNGVPVESDPFIVFAGDTCSTFGFPEHDYVGRATRTLAQWEAYEVEKEFWTGAQAKAGNVAHPGSYAADQWLASASATLIAGGGALPPVEAMSAIHTTLADCTGGAPFVIHAPRALLAYWENAFLVHREGTRYVDGLGNTVVFGAGYPGTSPAGGTPAANSTWVYVTSPVRYWATDTDILPDNYSAAIDRTNNVVTFLAERYFLVDYDRCCHFAGLVSLTTAG